MLEQTKVKRGRPRKSPQVEVVKQGRGRPRKVVESKPFDPTSVELHRGQDLSFDDKLFNPLKTGNELDDIFSTDGGLMPAVNMILVGGPGSGKTTVALDVIADFTEQGYKCLYVAGEMDEIGHYKYCKRIPKFGKIETLFLKNHAEQCKEVLEYVFNKGYDVIVIDSIAEVIEMVKDNYNVSMGNAESWFLSLQTSNKKGNNEGNYYTSFINIQQVTKGGEFAGSNRLKHMTDSMCHIERNKDGTERSMYFSKNRDCDKDFKVFFSISGNAVYYTYELTTE